MDKDYYETLVFENNEQKDIMNIAINKVRDYIRHNNKILVGGMAIDLALRKIGKKLYPDNKFPDYDFISSEFHIDAYRLGEQIAVDQDGVSIISALHASTMKVRLNFQEFADITYVPQNIIENIPVDSFNGFKFVHPHWQMIDQHRALSLPFEGPPMETVFGRWDKDIKRYDLLNENYPLNINEMEFKTTRYVVPKSAIDCMTGVPALLYWAKSASNDGMVIENGWRTSFTESKRAISLDMPLNTVFSIRTDNIKVLLNKISGSKVYYNAILDKIPRRVVIGGEEKKTTIEHNSSFSDLMRSDASLHGIETKEKKLSSIDIPGIFELIDNYGNLIGAYNVSSYHVANLQDVMCYLLTMGVLYNIDEMKYFYKMAQSILFWAIEEYKKNEDEKYLKYLPTIDIYGSYNLQEATLLSKENFSAQFEGGEKVVATPKNAYPERNSTVPDSYNNFIPEHSSILQYNGCVVNSF